MGIQLIRVPTRFANEDPTILGTPSNPAEVVGLCAGGLPAVVAMAAKDTSHLFSLGRELISVSFDLALEGRTRMRLIEESSNQSWGKTYTGLSQTTVRGILDEFHKDLVSKLGDGKSHPRFQC